MPTATTSIQRLTPETVHKIAAGEVIERPANVVKELVENALDAGARKISVLLEAGGLELIRVVDNGSGMVREDARLAWLPHTTSKIRVSEDLDRIASYGFRGEALCSMAAVSELTIETRHASEDTGISLTVSGTSELGEREIGRNPGCTVTVKNLFLNNPVRRKFMGSGKSEAARVANMISRVALAHPGVGFKLSENGRDLLTLAEGTLKNRTGETLGYNVTNQLLPVSWSDGVIHVEGFVSTPQQARLRASHQYFYVNRRAVQSGMLSRALSQSYDVLPPGRVPIAALFITVPPGDVDVNVHPTKREVRFLNESRVFWSLNQAVKTALRTMVEAPTLDLSPDPPAGIDAGGAGDGALPSYPAFRYDAPERTDAAGAGTLEELPAQILAFPESPQFPQGLSVPADTFDPSPGWTPARGSSPFSLGAGAHFLQLHRGFILFEVQNGFTLVNQQAAHERVLYEKALEELRRPGRLSSQQLLFPEILEFVPAESLFLEERIGTLQSLGFDLEAFGGNTFQLRGLPMEVKPERARQVLYAMVRDLMRPERAAGSVDAPEAFLQKTARVYANATSIKLGDTLDNARISALMDGLFATQNPYVSPSGAPILVRFSLEEIRRKFGLK